MKTTNSLIILSLILLSTGCFKPNSNTDYGRYGGKLSTPSEAAVSFDNSTIHNFDESNINVLKQYLAGNARWEIRKERGKVYAVRKEIRNGKYETTLNGYYSNFDNPSGIYQTRVIVSFDKYYGFGNDESCITFASHNDKDIQITIESEHSGTPGNSSYLIIKGKGINIEIYEQAEDIRRNFTSRAIEELNMELSQILKYRKEIQQTGLMPLTDYYPQIFKEEFFNISDGMQPGIYIVTAGIRVNQEGEAYIKVFETKTGQQLSAERIKPRTTRIVGWSQSGKTVFPYESQLTVYEGDWEHEYEARFEIWFQPKDGKEIKLTEKTRQINGWEQ